MNGSYVFEVYVQWKTRIAIISKQDGLHMFLELNVHKLNYKLNENNKWTKCWGSFSHVRDRND